jgi:hypothetical protein
MMTESRNNVSELLTKTLLQDFEASAQSRQHFNLVALCDQCPSLYGDRASDLRRLVQQKWAKIKRKPTPTYIQYLLRYGITVGTFTASETMTNDGTSSDDNTPSPPKDKNPTKPTADTAPSTPTRSKSSESPVPSSSVVRSSLSPFPPYAPALPYNASPAPASPYRHHQFGQTSNLVAVAAVTTTPPALSWSSFQDGSKAHPWITIVNKEQPEANREFDIQFVQNMTHGNYERNGYHIRLTVAAMDYDAWEATTPNSGGYPPEFERRLIMLKGPSQSSWERNTERYHATKKVNCARTKAAHSGTEIEISKDLARQQSHWLLVFPQGTILDNQIFSDDDGEVAVTLNPITSKTNDEGNSFRKDMRGLVLFWCIAVAGGRKVGKVTKKPKATELF